MAPFGRTAGDANPQGTHPGGSGALPGPAPNTAGPHKSDLLNKLDPTVDSMHGGTQILGPGINQSADGAKPHPRHPSNPATHNPSAGVPHSTHEPSVGRQSGPPHNSNLANKLDPRVETGSGQIPPGAHASHGAPVHQTVPSGTHAGYGAPGHHAAPPGTHAGHGAPGYHPTPGAGNDFAAHGGAGNNNTGPHSSNLMNKLDPRVETGNPSSGAMAPGAATGHHAGTHGHSGVAATHGHPGAAGTHGHSAVAGTHGHPGMAGTHGHPGVADNYGQQGMGTHNYGQPGVAGYDQGAHGNNSNNGPHNSSLANKLDPRVDTSNPSMGANPPGAGATHRGAPMDPMTNHPSHGTHAHQDPRVGHTADPRFDSGHGNVAHAPAHGQTTIHQGPEVLPGPASKTAGPHSSNLLNKLNPNVDSKAAVTQQREYRTS